MVIIHPSVVHNTTLIQTLQAATGLTSYAIPGRSYAVLSAPNLSVFVKPAPRKAATFRANWNGGGDAA
jgi:hypothetical protein